MTTKIFSNVFYVPVFTIGLMMGLAANGHLSSAFLTSALSTGGLIAASWGLWERNKRQYFERRMRSLAMDLERMNIPKAGGFLIGPNGSRYFLDYFDGRAWITDHSVKVDPIKLSYALEGKNGWRYESPAEEYNEDEAK